MGIFDKFRKHSDWPTAEGTLTENALPLDDEEFTSGEEYYLSGHYIIAGEYYSWEYSRKFEKFTDMKTFAELTSGLRSIPIRYNPSSLSEYRVEESVFESR